MFALSLKLKEYSKRYVHTPPEMNPFDCMKTLLMFRLLHDGSLCRQSPLQAFRRCSWFSESLIDAALSDIEAYNSNSLSTLVGGTGLPEVLVEELWQGIDAPETRP